MLYLAPALNDHELKVIADIEALRQRLRMNLHEPRRWAGTLRRHAFARNLQSSNSIEGITATLDDADAIALHEEPLTADNPTRDAMAGYRDAMTYVLRLANDTDFGYSADLLRGLHFMLTNHDLNARPGQWRAGSVYVRAEHDGAIVYTGPEVESVPALMRELIAELTADSTAAPIVAAAMAHLNLVRIHPFRDGNGRMARILQSLVLARAGVLSAEFVSIEEYLGHTTDAYYAALATTGATWEPATDTRTWLRFVLTAHHAQARTLLRRVGESESMWSQLEEAVARLGLPERTMYALFDSANNKVVRPAVYRAVLAANGMPISAQTAARDLADLVGAGLLKPVGSGRGRVYHPAGEVVSVRRLVVDQRKQDPNPDPFAG